MKPIEQVGGWLFRVARNRIIDLFRKKRPERSASAPARTRTARMAARGSAAVAGGRTGGGLCPRRCSSKSSTALDELPAEQREVFVAHEIEGRSFKELAAETGVNVNTLLSRKRYAVLFCASGCSAFYAEFRKDEGHDHEKNDGSSVPFVAGRHGALCVPGGGRAAAVELADAVALRLRAITFWQALGLLALCRILFGGLGGHGGAGAVTPARRFEERITNACGSAGSG